MRRSITLATDRFPERPGFDAAVSRAVLNGVASGALTETLRLYVPDRLVAFGSQDAVHPAYQEAIRAAAAAGFGAYHRLAGGRAAVFHEHTICFGWAIPTPVPRSTVEVRFRETGAILSAALTGLGIDARIGEVPGEYCPGTYSISAGGRTKLIGIGQRLVDKAAHVGGVIVVDRADLVNRALVPVYQALGYEWDPATTGAIADEVPIDVAGVMTAIREAFAARHQISDGAIDAATLAEAARLEANPLHPR